MAAASSRAYTSSMAMTWAVQGPQVASLSFTERITAEGLALLRQLGSTRDVGSRDGHAAQPWAYVVASVDSAAGSSASLAPSSSTRYALIR